MKRKQLYNAMAIILATSTLVACGGGGGSDGGTTTTSSRDASIVGTITHFGSIYVNGIEFETDSSGYDIDDDTATDQSDLAVGMKVKVEGTINDDGVTGSANNIYYDDDVEGPIDNGSMQQLDATTKSFSVLGLAVQMDSTTTVFDDGASFDTLAQGNIVEVSGYFDGIQIVATRIEKQDDQDDEFEIKGTVENYDGLTISLTLLSGVTVGPYDVSSDVDSDISPDTSGQFVEVKLNDTGSGMEAIEIELDDEDLLDDDDDDVSIHGVITGDANDGFMINNVPFSVTDNTQYEPVDLVLVDGMEAEVEGIMQDDGTLIADKIEAEEEGEIEIEAQVTIVKTIDGAISLDMGDSQSLTVQTENTTLFEDDSALDTDGDGSFTLSELSSADFVEVEAYSSGDELIATKIKREDDVDSETTLKAPVESFDFDSDNKYITLQGISYTMDEGTSYDPGNLFDDLALGDVVKIKDLEPDGTAEEVELED